MTEVSKALNLVVDDEFHVHGHGPDDTLVGGSGQREWRGDGAGGGGVAL